MNDRENLHAGHRERMIDKFIANSSGMADHELLEMLLFSFIPRKNTNDIAHALLRKFDNLKGVFNAKIDELTMVKGVGKRTASYISIVATIFNRIEKSENPEKQSAWTFSRIYGYVKDLFENIHQEKVVIILFDKYFRKINLLDFQDDKINKVSGDVTEIANAFAISKPKYAIIAHNHPSGNLNPSEQDDFATAKLNLLCSTHGVTLIDHIIVDKDKSYSYHLTNRMEMIKQKFNIEKLLQKVKEKDIIWET